uniref:WD_REPEATS_REGION domain-containing protein n=1 Tax=Macrostomum lignano TaxID=282301 RepID=A0A1I8JP31_9PLAT
ASASGGGQATQLRERSCAGAGGPAHPSPALRALAPPSKALSAKRGDPSRPASFIRTSEQSPPQPPPPPLIVFGVFDCAVDVASRHASRPSPPPRPLPCQQHVFANSASNRFGSLRRLLPQCGILRSRSTWLPPAPSGRTAAWWADDDDCAGVRACTMPLAAATCAAALVALPPPAPHREYPSWLFLRSLSHIFGASLGGFLAQNSPNRSTAGQAGCHRLACSGNSFVETSIFQQLIPLSRELLAAAAVVLRSTIHLQPFLNSPLSPADDSVNPTRLRLCRRRPVTSAASDGRLCALSPAVMEFQEAEAAAMQGHHLSGQAGGGGGHSEEEGNLQVRGALAGVQHELVRAADGQRLSAGASASFVEEYNNKLQIVALDDERGELTLPQHLRRTRTRATAHYGSAGSADLLATSGDYLRVWRVVSDTETKLECLLKQQQELRLLRSAHLLRLERSRPEHTRHLQQSTPPAPSGDSRCEPTTDSNWPGGGARVSSGHVKTQLIAHDKEVYDIAFSRQGGGRDMFASVGADGSVRMFDLRHLEHSTIIYEDPGHSPLLRLAWNRQDPNYLATFAMDASEVIVLDTRVPCTPVARLSQPPSLR